MQAQARYNANAAVGDAFTNQLRQQQAELNYRQQDPEGAGVRDISEGRSTSALAVQEIDRLAALMDNDWGGFSYDAERELAAALQQPPYNMPQPEAEAAANAAANRRRRPWNQSAPPRQPTAAPPQAAGAPAAPLPDSPLPTMPSPAAWGGEAG